MQLSDIIIQKIQRDGPLAFNEYMELCLYHPTLGYYSSSDNAIGKQGDFYTSSCLGNIFGIMIAKQIEEMWESLGMGHFTIVEYGAGTGILCHDILLYLQKNSPLYDALTYCIIEKSGAMRKKEKALLSEKVSWHDSICEIGPVTGCILSNELLDNFAVHQIVMNDGPEEISVDYKNSLSELLKPASDNVKEYLKELNIHLPLGYRTEINTDAIDWVKEVATHLAYGYVITIDYGYPSSELYKPYRNSGSLVCYYKHQINTNPFIHIGEQDITSHVNFSALCHWGLKNGLSYLGFTDQAHFLLDLGIEEELKRMRTHKPHPLSIKQELILKHLLLEDMGRTFKVLIQGKGTNRNQISGLRSVQ